MFSLSVPRGLSLTHVRSYANDLRSSPFVAKTCFDVKNLFPYRALLTRLLLLYISLSRSLICHCLYSNYAPSDFLEEIEFRTSVRLLHTIDASPRYCTCKLHLSVVVSSCRESLRLFQGVPVTGSVHRCSSFVTVIALLYRHSFTGFFVP